MIKFNYIEDEIIDSPHYESHYRGRNWACKISGKNSVNFKRENLQRRGASVSVENVIIGDALEFGGDYISGGGSRTPDRGYYLVKEVLTDGIICESYETIAKLLKAKNNLNK